MAQTAENQLHFLFHSYSGTIVADSFTARDRTGQHSVIVNQTAVETEFARRRVHDVAVIAQTGREIPGNESSQSGNDHAVLSENEKLDMF